MSWPLSFLLARYWPFLALALAAGLAVGWWLSARRRGEAPATDDEAALR